MSKTRYSRRAKGPPCDAQGGQAGQLSPQYTVPAGTRVLVRPSGGGEWQEHTTTRAVSFVNYAPADGGGHWLFEARGWQMKARPDLVAGRAARQKKKPPKRSRKRPYRVRPALSRCRDCGHEERVHRYLYFKASRPRCSHCGGSLDYTGGWQGAR